MRLKHYTGLEYSESIKNNLAFLTGSTYRITTLEEEDMSLIAVLNDAEGQKKCLLQNKYKNTNRKSNVLFFLFLPHWAFGSAL